MRKFVHLAPKILKRISSSIYVFSGGEATGVPKTNSACNFQSAGIPNCSTRAVGFASTFCGCVGGGKEKGGGNRKEC